MVLLIPLFGLLAIVCLAASMFIARAVGPRFKSLEMRGIIRTPVPDLTNGRANGFRAFRLLWLTPIPEDRPQLKRLVGAYRATQVAAPLLMLAAFIMALAAGVSTPSGRDRDAPPPVTLPVQDH